MIRHGARQARLRDRTCCVVANSNTDPVRGTSPLGFVRPRLHPRPHRPPSRRLRLRGATFTLPAAAEVAGAGTLAVNCQRPGADRLLHAVAGARLFHEAYLHSVQPPRNSPRLVGARGRSALLSFPPGRTASSHTPQRFWPSGHSRADRAGPGRLPCRACRRARVELATARSPRATTRSARSFGRSVHNRQPTWCGGRWPP